MKRLLFYLVVILSLVGIVQKFVHASELLGRTRSDYEHELDLYRELYGDFLLKRTQYEQVSTFALQEELLSAAKMMLEQRRQVWWTYWQALKIEVIETEGFDEEQKAEIESEIESIQKVLLEQKTNIEEITGIQQLLVLAKEGSEFSEDYNYLTYKSLMRVRLARFTHSIRTLEPFIKQTQSLVRVQVRDVQERELIIKGLVEVEQQLSVIKQQVEEIGAEYDDFEEVRNAEKEHKGLVKELTPLYHELEQVMKLIRELSFGVEL